uniref:Putative capsid protein n=1 Tax=viral metagenome TaxID=1070528 RepID=A0A6M3IG07_9ZZZZ
MPIQPNADSVITKTTYPDLLNKAIDVVWMRRDEVAGNVLGQFFDTQSKSEGLTHVISSVSSVLPLPIENEDTEALPYHASAPGFDKTFTVVNYRSGIRVTRTMIEADRFSKINQMISGQIKSAMRKDEYMRAAILNNAFTGDDGADAKDLCDDAHPQERTDMTSNTTWDNKSTGALTLANLHALRLLTRKMTNEAGDPDPVMSNTLLVPEDLEQKANELVGATAKPEGALNDPNVLIRGLKIVVSPYLSSATQYYIFGDRQGENKGLHEIVLSDWSIMDNTPSNADIVIDKRIRGVKTFGFTVSRNIFGSTGS